MKQKTKSFRKIIAQQAEIIAQQKRTIELQTKHIKELVFDQEYTNTNGKVEWNLKNKEGNPVASGVYIYLITNNKGDKAIGKLGIVK
ncbi:MAG: hypothetical protein AB1595_06170 [bacterium]